MISFRKVTKFFGSHLVLDEVSFEILPNEFVLLSGVSGVGKSTIVGLLIGAEQPDSGVIEVDGIAVNTMHSDLLQLYRRKIGVVYQDYKLLPTKTVFENVAFAMEVCEAPSVLIKERVPEVLKKVGLYESGHQFPDQLSGGERQRLAIARALVHNPRLLIADEPTGNLDEENARGIVNLFNQLHKEGATVLLTTHDPVVRSLVLARNLILSKGKLLE